MKSFGDLFSDSWRKYKENFSLFLKIFLIFSAIPSIIFSIAVFMISRDYYSIGLTDYSALVLPDLIANPFSLILIIALGVVIFILDYIMMLSFFYITIYSKKNMRLKEAVKGGLGYFWKFAGLSIVIFLIILGIFSPLILFLIIGSIYNLAELPFLIIFIILLIALIIPLVIFTVYWSFSPYILINENIRIWASLKKSQSIIKGRWWKVFGYGLLFMIITIGISILFSVPEMIFNIYNFLVDLPMERIAVEYSWGSLITAFILGIISMISSLITTPLQILFMNNFYSEMKRSK